MSNEEIQELKKEFSDKERENKLPYPYRTFLEGLFNEYYLSKIHSSLRKKYKLFNLSPHLDYVVELTPLEMPINYIIESRRGKNDIIPNINKIDININENHDTVFERITKTELLGCFAKVNNTLIEELKDNGFHEYEYTTRNGEKINIKVDDLLNKKVIFMCPENIKITCNNIKPLFLNNDEVNYPELLKIVFFHEYGHCAFYDINSDQNYTYIHERQANYYASIVLNGQYDLLIEILNNRIGKQYKNPLLKSHEYTKGIIEFEKEEDKLYE